MGAELNAPYWSTLLCTIARTIADRHVEIWRDTLQRLRGIAMQVPLLRVNGLFHQHRMLARINCHRSANHMFICSLSRSRSSLPGLCMLHRATFGRVHRQHRYSCTHFRRPKSPPHHNEHLTFFALGLGPPD